MFSNIHPKPQHQNHDHMSTNTTNTIKTLTNIYLQRWALTKRMLLGSASTTAPHYAPQNQQVLVFAKFFQFY